MTDPIIKAAVDLKKEMETDTSPELQAALKGPMDEIMKMILSATQPAPEKRKQ